MTPMLLGRWKHRLLETAFLAVGLLVWISGNALAQEETETGSGGCGDLPDSLQAIERFLTQLQEIGLVVAFLLAAVMLTYAGLLYMSGDPSKQDQARRLIVNTFTGLIIVAVAGGLVEVASQALCGGGAG